MKTKFDFDQTPETGWCPGCGNFSILKVLKGEKIPVIARIVAIADSFDAMTTQRPYRDALTPVQAFDEIVSGSGIQYDPLIVETFQHAWESGDIIEIFRAFP